MKKDEAMKWLEYEKEVNRQLKVGLEDTTKLYKLNKIEEALEEGITAIIERDEISQNAVNVIVQNATLRQIIEDIKNYVPKAVAEGVQAKLAELRDKR
jgi:hypothetical protein